MEKLSSRKWQQKAENERSPLQVGCYYFGRKFTYVNIKYCEPEKKWVDATRYLPLDGDLVELHCLDEKPRKGWRYFNKWYVNGDRYHGPDVLTWRKLCERKFLGELLSLN